MANTPYVFTSAADVCNRALQHVGARRITNLTDDSVQANECQFCYDKLRQAELRRNFWRFAIRKARIPPVSLNSFALVAPAWSSVTTYAAGAVVTQSGLVWQSTVGANLNNTPGDDTPQWQLYFGAQNVEPWNSQTTYSAGDTVYMPGLWTNTFAFAMSAQCTYNGVVYQSLVANNTGLEPDLNSAPTWNADISYNANVLVTYSSVVYQSLGQYNIGNTPSSSPANWAVYTGTVAWEVVASPTFTVYLSLVPSNSDMPGSTKWLALSATLGPLNILYPITVGPVEDSSSYNAFILPFNFLRQAPDNPKQGSTSYLGSSTGLQYQDYVFENNMFTSRTSYPLMLRFVADNSTVSQFDPMFAEGLAARIALEVGERLTQAGDKLGRITQEYMKFMGEARAVDSIEEGPTEPPEDDWIICRI